MPDALQGLFVLMLGFALVRVGTYLIRLYERAFHLEPRKVMSWDLFAVFSLGPWAPVFTLGVLCIFGGVGTMIGAAIMLLFDLLNAFL